MSKYIMLTKEDVATLEKCFDKLPVKAERMAAKNFFISGIFLSLKGKNMAGYHSRRLAMEIAKTPRALAAKLQKVFETPKINRDFETMAWNLAIAIEANADFTDLLRPESETYQVERKHSKA